MTHREIRQYGVGLVYHPLISKVKENANPREQAPGLRSHYTYSHTTFESLVPEGEICAALTRGLPTSFNLINLKLLQIFLRPDSDKFLELNFRDETERFRKMRRNDYGKMRRERGRMISEIILVFPEGRSQDC